MTALERAAVRAALTVIARTDTTRAGHLNPDRPHDRGIIAAHASYRAEFALHPDWTTRGPALAAWPSRATPHQPADDYRRGWAAFAATVGLVALGDEPTVRRILEEDLVSLPLEAMDPASSVAAAWGIDDPEGVRKVRDTYERLREPGSH